MEKFSIIEVNDLAFLTGPMRAVEVYPESVTLSNKRGERYSFLTEGYSPNERAEIIRSDWEPSWFPMPEVGAPRKGMLTFRLA